MTRIHGLDSAQSVRFSSVPPTDVRTPSPSSPVEASNVSLSSAVRALADAAAQRLPSTTGLHVFDLLTADDRRMLASTSDLARTHGFALEDLSKLVVDLIAYRDQQLAEGGLGSSLSAALKVAAQRGESDRATPSVASARPERAGPLSLLSFSARDEALARTILSSFAMRDTQIDHDFVRALLDPDRLATHAVDFAFLQRVVTALSPAHGDAAIDVEMTFARRDARARLSDALAGLGITTSELRRYLSEAAEHGAKQLHRRVSRTLFGADSPARTFHVLTTLTRNDRALLGLLYVAYRARRGDLALVDDFARALITFRESERAPLERPQARNSMRPEALRPSAAPAASAAAHDGRQDGTDEPLSQAPFARRFGSVSQLAARMVGSYRSLAPVSLAPTQVIARPFNVVEALGLGALIGELHQKSQRNRRPRRVRLWRAATTLRARRRRSTHEPTLEELLRR